ncbi:sugar phosphate isomerase/epimerase family protein [Pseudoalteromonas sp. SSDWG2]|uniref:sugar phosphate isomerase/epimerase family protein n=1 Tax=Pseudoalteromonas sp. SSDWG2 TaxID=3139391 RepID=UPI003BA8E7C7
MKAFTKTMTSPSISVQLWSVKDELKADFHGTLTALANMGFEGVEFAGDFGPYASNPQQLHTLLSSLGLQASSAHVGFDQLSSETINSTLHFYKTLGVTSLYIPWDERAWDKDKIDEFITQLNAVHKTAQQLDMEIGFHNHDKEFLQFGDTTYWQHIADNTTASVPLQLDIGWVHYAKQNAIKLIKAYPKRTRSAHLKIVAKDNSLSPILGDNGFAWENIITSLRNDGHTQWLVVEQEQYPQGMSALQSVDASKRALDRILFLSTK